MERGWFVFVKLIKVVKLVRKTKIPTLAKALAILKMGKTTVFSEL